MEIAENIQVTPRGRLRAAACYFAWNLGVTAVIATPIGYFAPDLPGPWQVLALGSAPLLAAALIPRHEPPGIRRLGLRLFGFEYWKQPVR